MGFFVERCDSFYLSNVSLPIFSLVLNANDRRMKEWFMGAVMQDEQQRKTSSVGHNNRTFLYKSPTALKMQ